MFEPDVRLVDDLVDREGRGGRVGMVAVPRGQLLGDLVEPFVEQGFGPRIERGEGADDPGLALGDDQIGHRDDEERRADDGQPQAIEERGKGHDQVS